LDFFDRLVLRVTGIFLIEDLVVLGACIAGSTSCVEGSSGVAARVEGASTTSFCGSSSSLQEETGFIQPNRKKARTSKLQNPQKHLRCHEVKELDTFFENRGFVSRSSLCRGTRRSKLVDTLPLFVYTSVFGKRRRRRRRRVGIFFGFFGFISILIFFSLGGFRYSGGQISRKRPFF
jgi:hypothetical protein